MPTTQSQEFLVSGNFVVPAGVSSIWVTMVAGGGGGGSSIGFLEFHGAGGGGAAEFCRRMPVKVTPGDSIAVTLGAGGLGALVGGTVGAQGGVTSFGALLRVQGGWGGSPNGTAGGAHTGCFSGSGGNGGGRGGLRGGGEFGCNTTGGNAGNHGKIGVAEGPWFFGGSGGGAGALGGATAPVAVGHFGGPSEGQIGGLGGNGYLTGVGNYGGGGGGGGASMWGPGGRGGDGMLPPFVAFNGDGKVGVGYGSGGGGSASLYRSLGASWKGGDGAPGYCLVDWVA